MAKSAHAADKVVPALRRLALGYPETEEGVSCSKAAFKARGKAFLFVGADESSFNVMVKLKDSLAQAAQLQADQPQNYKVGVNGWVNATFAYDDEIPAGILQRWLDESFRLLAHKQLVAMLPAKVMAKKS